MTARKTITGTDRQNAHLELQAKNIRTALIEAENSGEPQPFDPSAFKRRMQETHG